MIRQVNGSSVFARNNEILTTREVIPLLPDGSKEQQLLRGSHLHRALAAGTAVAGFVYLGTGILRTAEHFEDEGGMNALDQMIIGLGWLSISFWESKVSRQKARQAVDMYNASRLPDGPDTGSHFRLGAQANGLGLALRF